MWSQYVADLHWAAKAVFGAACPVYGGGMTFVQVDRQFSALSGAA